jgi:hypothetical protein
VEYNVKGAERKVYVPTHFSKGIELMTMVIGLAMPLGLLFLHDE